ncbi:Acetyl esterase/lipase [Ligilactobacillus sp. WC1T17]|uniref:Acetyl esterase/lipase n=1 Tax=Ligilactobacillus ruminis TaxID=1623 RepID=A0ABY1ABI5_9LACO|nr:Acetyl esterase/lipase [Ligilactobacillus ruminis]
MGLISLEKAALDLCQQSEKFIPTTIGLKAWRERLNLLQKMPVYQHEVTIMTEKILDEDQKKLTLQLFFPTNYQQKDKLSVVYFVHGGQFISGDAFCYHKLLAELANRGQVCVVFPEYCLAPESKAPAQLKQIKAGFEALSWLKDKYSLDLKRVICAGDDVGGGLALSLAYIATAPKIYKLLLLYPVVSAYFDNSSYYEFAGGYRISREQMKWAWQQYLGTDKAKDALYQPLLLSKKQLALMPETLIITAEADVTRSEGEAMGRKMRDAGVNVVEVGIQGIIHDFMMLNMLDKTNACRLAMNLAVDWIIKRKD